MPTDLEIALLLESQYNREQGIFDHDFSIEGDRCCIKYYPDCTVIAHEGSKDFLQWFNNAKFVMVQIPDFAGVDEGFDINIDAMTVEALPLIPKDKMVILAGHSRGAPRAFLMAARLIKQGYNITVVALASPRPGDAALTAILSKATIRSYRNYRDFDHQDVICDVPFPFPFKYVHPDPNPITFDIPPDPNDPTGELGRHHIQHYRAAIQEMQNAAK